MFRHIYDQSSIDSNHSPDCTSILDSELKQAVFSRWPHSDEGKVTTIPYSFSTIPLWKNAFITYEMRHLLPNPLSTISDNTKAFVAQALNDWSFASNGTIQFIENHFIHPFSQGIFFYISATVDEINADDEGTLAVTLHQFDNDGYTRQAFIFLPMDSHLWLNNSLEGIRAVRHEIGHALGFNHLHEFEKMYLKLRNITEGVYCSVMPYPEKIATAKSECNTSCDSPFALYPSSLDKRLLDLTYAKNSFVLVNTEMEWEDYIQNIVDACAISYTIAAGHQIAVGFFSNLTTKQNQYIFSKKVSSLISDFGLAAAVFYTAPAWSSYLFITTASTKYIPQSILNSMPEHN